MERRPKVYVVSKGSHDYKTAEEYGEVVFLYDETRKPNVFASDALVKEVEEKLADSTEEDYLILAGSMLPSAVAFHVLIEKHRHVHNLLYSFKNNNYELRTVRGSQFASMWEEVQ